MEEDIRLLSILLTATYSGFSSILWGQSQEKDYQPENEAATATGFEPQQDLPVSVFLLRSFLDGLEWPLKVNFHSDAWTFHGNKLHICNRQIGVVNSFSYCSAFLRARHPCVQFDSALLS